MLIHRQGRLASQAGVCLLLENRLLRRRTVPGTWPSLACSSSGGVSFRPPGGLRGCSVSFTCARSGGTVRVSRRPAPPYDWPNATKPGEIIPAVDRSLRARVRTSRCTYCAGRERADVATWVRRTRTAAAAGGSASTSLSRAAGRGRLQVPPLPAPGAPGTASWEARTQQAGWRARERKKMGVRRSARIRRMAQ